VTIRVAGICTAIVAATAATVASAATPPIQPIPINPGGPNMPAATATLSDRKAGAKPVALTIRVHYEMVCGQPGLGTAIITIPAAATVPRSIPASAVLVNGKSAPAVEVDGHQVTVSMPVHRGVTCLVVGPGTLTLLLTHDAGLGNPRAAGTYAIHIRRNRIAFTAKVAISA
jgi:hypothetical protein